MSVKEQSFRTFREFLASLDKPEEREHHKILIIPEHGPVMTSILTMVQSLHYLIDKVLDSSGEYTIEDGMCLVFLDIDKGQERSWRYIIMPYHEFMAKREEVKERCYQEKTNQAIVEGAAYFICSFRQQEGPWGNSTMDVSFVHPQSFPGNQKEEADKKAGELESACYEKNDYNVRIVARLAKSIEDAKQGIFLDD